MKTMAIGAAAMAGLLVSAAPAAAQKADPDALCMVALYAAVQALERTPKPWDDEVKRWQLSLEFSVGFYSGSLLARVPETQLQPRFKVAISDYLALPPDQQEKQLIACINTAEDLAFTKVSAAFNAALTGKKN